MRKLAVLVAVFTLCLSATPVRAHHSFSAEFDASKQTKVTGAVTKLEWMNPHVWFFVDVKDETARSQTGELRWVAQTA
jgi:hypothetical protein